VTPDAFASPRAAWKGGAVEALGVPAAVLGAGYIGFGALAFDADFSLALALFSTMTIWALPGQIALIELRELGTAAPALVLAVMLTSARFLPMTVTLLPLLRHPAYRTWHYYLAGHFVAMTGWAVAVRRCPMLPLEQRLPYFLGFAIALWLACLAGTAAGYFASSSLPNWSPSASSSSTPSISSSSSAARCATARACWRCCAARLPDRSCSCHAAMGPAGGRHHRRHGGLRGRSRLEEEP
jgi:predicted branched-subunit amino acid permease